jgi:formyltetrahydrofolate hydrolase
MKNKIYILTSNDEWLTTILINKLNKENEISLVKIKDNKTDFLKLFKFLLLFGVINMLKIYIIQKKKKNFKIIFLEKNKLNKFIKEKKDNKIFLINYADKIKYNFKNIYNCHPSLTPNYKGLMPIPRYLYDSIINNKKYELGLTIHKINQKFDSGKIIWNKKIKIKKYLIKDIYEEVYSNFYYGIKKINSPNRVKINTVKPIQNEKSNLSLIEIILLKINLYKKNLL